MTNLGRAKSDFPQRLVSSGLIRDLAYSANGAPAGQKKVSGLSISVFAVRLLDEPSTEPAWARRMHP
jgi:hypothetical protein